MFTRTLDPPARRFRRQFLSGLRSFEEGTDGDITSYVVYRGKEELRVDGTRVLPVGEFLRRLHGGKG